MTREKWTDEVMKSVETNKTGSTRRKVDTARKYQMTEKNMHTFFEGRGFIVHRRKKWYVIVRTIADEAKPKTPPS